MAYLSSKPLPRDPDLRAFAKALQKEGLDPSVITLEEATQACRALFQESFKGYIPHPKQASFHKAGKSARQRLFLAGNRTGKTLCAAVEVSMHLTGIYPPWWQGYRYDHPVDVWVASNTAQTTKNILQEEKYIGKDGGELGYIPKHLIERMTRLNGIADGIDTVYVKHRSGGLSTLAFKSYDQGRTKFQGTKKHIIHFDEEPPYPVYTEALMRIMGVGDHYGMILLTMTPLMGMTPLLQSFMEDVHAETIQDSKFYIQASWQDNPHLHAKEILETKKSFPAHEQEAREKGIPSLGSGMIYPVSEEMLFIEPRPIASHWARVYGMDFGWSNPTAVLFAAHDRDNDVVYIYGEYAQKERTPEQHAFALLKKGCAKMSGVYDPAGDHASQKDGESLVELYRQAGLKYLNKADNAKEKGLMSVLQYMQNGQLKIFNTLTKTRSELRGYTRDLEGRPIKRNDHLMDCLRYIIISGLGYARSPQSEPRRVLMPPQAHSWMGL